MMTSEEIQQAREIARETLNLGGWFAPGQPSVDKLARAVLALTDQLTAAEAHVADLRTRIRELEATEQPEPASRADLLNDLIEFQGTSRDRRATIAYVEGLLSRYTITRKSVDGAE